MTKRRKAKDYMPRPRTSSSEDKLDGMPTPNHGISDALAIERITGKDVRYKDFPLTHLQIPETPESAEGSHLAFVAKLHGVTHWSELYRGVSLCEDCSKDNEITYLSIPSPPTWIDPIVFAKMCKKDDKVREAMSTASESNSKRAWTNLATEIQRVLVQQYVPFMQRKLAEAADVYGRWLVMHALREQQDNESRSKDKAAAANVISALRKRVRRRSELSGPDTSR